MPNQPDDTNPACPVCSVPWRDHPGPTAMCEEIARLTARVTELTAQLARFCRAECCDKAELLEEIDRLRAEREADMVAASDAIRELQDEINWLQTLVPPQTLASVARQLDDALKEAAEAAGGEDGK